VIGVALDYDTIECFEEYLINNEKKLDESDKNYINNSIHKIKVENDINEKNLSLLELCIN